ncbi:hypothetical protein ElyMa_002505900 [Elysia marginata]|uniref:Uncharacterized protein n=1 Tax=Elysia marginata TaxID=1093978 RepID=A0AAV4GQC9_9GAST|nr:hypothetical protein ElyMa_002505900 [Elysia marginata]
MCEKPFSGIKLTNEGSTLGPNGWRAECLPLHHDAILVVDEPNRLVKRCTLTYQSIRGPAAAPQGAVNCRRESGLSTGSVPALPATQWRHSGRLRATAGGHCCPSQTCLFRGVNPPARAPSPGNNSFTERAPSHLTPELEALDPLACVEARQQQSFKIEMCGEPWSSMYAPNRALDDDDDDDDDDDHDDDDDDDDDHDDDDDDFP